MPAASTVNPKEREFVVDSGASTHMASKKDLNEAELETMRISTIPTKVVTANGEVLAKEEATVYVRDLDLFVTVMLLENWKILRIVWVYNWTSGQKPHLIKNGRMIDCNTANYVLFVVPGLSTSSTSSSSTSPTSSSQETLTDTEIPATRRSGSTDE